MIIEEAIISCRNSPLASQFASICNDMYKENYITLD